MKLNYTKAMAVAIVVGSLLNLINQWEGIFANDSIDALKVTLTYLVPFCVFLFGQWSSDRTV